MHEHVYEEIDKQMKTVLIIMDKNTKQQNTVKQEGFLAQLPCCPVGWPRELFVLQFFFSVCYNHCKHEFIGNEGLHRKLCNISRCAKPGELAKAS